MVKSDSTLPGRFPADRQSLSYGWFQDRSFSVGRTTLDQTQVKRAVVYVSDQIRPLHSLYKENKLTLPAGIAVGVGSEVVPTLASDASPLLFQSQVTRQPRCRSTEVDLKRVQRGDTRTQEILLLYHTATRRAFEGVSERFLTLFGPLGAGMPSSMLPRVV